MSHYIYLYIYVSIIYYFWIIVYIISQLSYIFRWLNCLSVNEFIFYYIYFTKIIYVALLKLYIYDFIYIYIPYYIIQPIYNIYIFFYEFYFTVKYIKYFAYFIYFFIILGNICNLIIESMYTNFFYIILVIKYLLFLLIFIYVNIIKYINILLLMYIFLVSDIIYHMNLINIIKYLYIYTNIDFFIFDKYSKINILIDSFYSSFRFPIEYFNKLNNYKNYHKYIQKDYFLIKKERVEFLANILTFDYSRDNLMVGRWKKKTITVLSKYYINHYNDNLPKWYLVLDTKSNYNLKYLYFSYKIFKFRKLLILFPYIYSLFAVYYICVYIISIFFILKLYKTLFLSQFIKNNQLYYSNSYSWDILRKKIIDDNYKLIIKKNNNLYDYYYKQIITNKDYIITNSIKNDVLKTKTKNNKNIKKIYINFYINYIFIKNLIKKLSRKKYYDHLNKYKSKFKLLLKLKSKFFSFMIIWKKLLLILEI